MYRMENMKRYLENWKNYLLKLKTEKEKALLNAPKGTLRVVCGAVETKYYKRENPKNTTGIYIPKKDIKIAKELAQKDYDEKVLQCVNQELKFISNTMMSMPKKFHEQVYEQLHPLRQTLIIPTREPDEQFIKKWEEFEYDKKLFDPDFPEYRTDKNERVRSKSEILIANLLNKLGIPYRYECPLKLKSIGSSNPNLTIYPDFTLLDKRNRKEVFLEHFGMMDNLEYVENVVLKLSTYESNGIYVGKQLLVTYETGKQPFNQKNLQRKLKDFFEI